MFHLGGSSVYVRIRLKLSYQSKLQNNFPTFQEIKIDAKKKLHECASHLFSKVGRHRIRLNRKLIISVCTLRTNDSSLMLGILMMLAFM